MSATRETRGSGQPARVDRACVQIKTISCFWDIVHWSRPRGRTLEIYILLALGDGDLRTGCLDAIYANLCKYAHLWRFMQICVRMHFVRNSCWFARSDANHANLRANAFSTQLIQVCAA